MGSLRFHFCCSSRIGAHACFKTVGQNIASFKVSCQPSFVVILGLASMHILGLFKRTLYTHVLLSFFITLSVLRYVFSTIDLEVSHAFTFPLKHVQQQPQQPCIMCHRRCSENQHHADHLVVSCHVTLPARASLEIMSKFESGHQSCQWIG